MVLVFFSLYFIFFLLSIFILDDSSIFEVINDCMITCNKRGIDHYRNKSQENQIYDNNMDTTTQESSENEKNVIY